MKLLSKILKDSGNNMLTYICPGCSETHSIKLCEGLWSWNGNADKPTFSHFILVTWPANQNAEDERRCHSSVIGGLIHFLDDCTHSLSGKITDMVSFN